MSGSPKYTTVTVSRERLQREAEARARRAAQRRERQEARVARLRALEEERARQRLAREAEQLSKVLQDSRRAVSEQVEAVGVMVADVRREVPDAGAVAIADQIRTLQADLADLDSKIRIGSDLAEYQRAAESLRTRALALRAGAFSAAGRAGRQQVLADFGRRLAALDAGAVTLDARQRVRCDELVARLRSAATETEGVRFEALHGTAEHAVASLERKAADLLGRQQVAVTGADRARAAQAAAAAQDRLDEAAARLEVIAAAVQEAASDAAAFAEHELSDQLEGALAAAVAAVSAGPAARQAEGGQSAVKPSEAGQPAAGQPAAGQPAAGPAEAAVAEAAVGAVAWLERLLTEAEARLDESQAAYERRGELAIALQDLLTTRGMTFTGGSDDGGRFLLNFERPGGAVYAATIDSDEHGDMTLSYAIDGEQDVPVLAAPGEVVCDRTEAFLNAVHEGLAVRGFEAGDLRWNGKPPRGQARALPGHQTRRTPSASPADLGRRRQHE